MNGIITWFGDYALSHLVLEWSDGRKEYYQWDTPIDSATDSERIANLFGHEYSAIEHDGEYIHVTTTPQ